MPLPVKLFLEVHQAISASDELEFVVPIKVDLLAEADRSFDKAAFAEMFKEDFGVECPKSVADLMALPDSVAMVWQGSGGAGEMRLLNPSVGFESHVDPSYQVKSMPEVSHMAVLDQVTDIAAPLFTLYDKVNVDTEGLWLFDGKNIGQIALTPMQYVEMAGLLGAFDSWQFLFSDLPITLDRKKAMLLSFTVLEDLMPDRDFSAAQNGLKKVRGS
jgi:hypothetical protein